MVKLIQVQHNLSPDDSERRWGLDGIQKPGTNI